MVMYVNSMALSVRFNQYGIIKSDGFAQQLSLNCTKIKWDTEKIERLSTRKKEA